MTTAKLESGGYLTGVTADKLSTYVKAQVGTSEGLYPDDWTGHVTGGTDFSTSRPIPHGYYGSNYPFSHSWYAGGSASVPEIGINFWGPATGWNGSNDYNYDRIEVVWDGTNGTRLYKWKEATQTLLFNSSTAYAASSHTHSNYAASNHTHTGYASSNHSHSISLTRSVKQFTTSVTLAAGAANWAVALSGSYDSSYTVSGISRIAFNSQQLTCMDAYIIKAENGTFSGQLALKNWSSSSVTATCYISLNLIKATIS